MMNLRGTFDKKKQSIREIEKMCTILLQYLLSNPKIKSVCKTTLSNFIYFLLKLGYKKSNLLNIYFLIN